MQCCIRRSFSAQRHWTYRSAVSTDDRQARLLIKRPHLVHGGMGRGLWCLRCRFVVPQRARVQDGLVASDVSRGRSTGLAHSQHRRAWETANYGEAGAARPGTRVALATAPRPPPVVCPDAASTGDARLGLVSPPAASPRSASDVSCARACLCVAACRRCLPADGGPDTSRQYVTRFVRVAYLSAHLRPSRVLSIDRLVDGLAHRTPHDPASLPQRPRIARPLPPSPPIFPHSYSLTRPWRCSQARHATPPHRCPPIVVVTLRAPPICRRDSRTWHAVPSSVARR